MTVPEQALELARRQAAHRRGQYGQVEPIRVGPPYDQIAARLSAWAVPDPSHYEVRSIRRGGAPITWCKRLLVRLLMQFHGQLISDQSRFNVLMLSYVRTLEERVRELEVAVGGEPEPDESADAIEDDWA
jgi:hypothetical protein